MPREEMDPLRKYIDAFSSRLRIKDKTTRDRIISEISAKAGHVLKKGGGYDDLISVMGPPEELASTVSNPDNWFIDMGTPSSPEVPIRSFISHRGRIMLFSAFLLALVLSGLMVITGEFGLFVPVLLAFTITLWALMAAWFNQHLGYILTYKQFMNGKLKVSSVSINEMIISVTRHYFFAVILALVLMVSPLLFDHDSLFFSIPLGSMTIIGSLVMSILIVSESVKVLKGQ